MAEPTKITTYVTGGEPRFVRESILKTLEETYNVCFDILGWCGKTDNPCGDMPQVELVLHIKSMASHAHRLFAKKWSERHSCLMIETSTKFSQSKDLYDKILVPYLKSKTVVEEETQEKETPIQGETLMDKFSEKAIALESDLVHGNLVGTVLPYIKGESERYAQWLNNVLTQTPSYTEEDFKAMLAMWKEVGSWQGQTTKAHIVNRKAMLKEVKKQWLIDYVVNHNAKTMREVDVVHREVFGNVLSRPMQEFLNVEWFNSKPTTKEETVVSHPQPIQTLLEAIAKVEQPVVAPVVEHKPELVIPPQPSVILTKPRPIVVGMPQDHEVLFDNDVFVVNPKFGQVTLARVEAQVVLVGRKVALEYDEGSEQGVLLNVKLRGL